MPESKVYVLGAGASIGHSGGALPSIRTIFQRSVELNLLTPERAQTGERFAGLVQYVRDSFAKDITSPNEEIDVEDLLTNLDIDIERTQAASLLAAREEALFLIRQTLMQSPLLALRDAQPPEYELFTARLQPQDSVLTFNWDIILDEVLGRSILIDANPVIEPRPHRKVPLQPVS